MSVIRSNEYDDVTLGFYLDIPNLLIQLLNDKDILLDYLVRSVLGKAFFNEQENKRSTYCKEKIEERERKLKKLENLLVELRQGDDQVVVQQKVSIYDFFS